MHHRNLRAVALAKCNQALNLHSDGQWALLIKALSIRGLGDYEAADLNLKQLPLPRKRPNATGFLARAKMYAALLMDDKAIADCNSALQLSPSMEEAITLNTHCIKRQR
ncbi:MAG: hypothetical protein K2X93_05480 [Candidatus Obscuribacterales bacterium]|nr:hypothetical protein [Candidatus Obscuribacterales bacterium]